MRIIKFFLILLITFGFPLIFSDISFSKEIVLYSFEDGPEGWEIPDWALEKPDYVARRISISDSLFTEGKRSLEVGCDFNGAPAWSGAYVERVTDITDWSPFNYLSVDIFLPNDAPRGLRAKFILTVGEDWKWTEMNRSIPLTPGEWTVIKVDIAPDSTGWRRFITESFRSDVKKLGVRVESNGKVRYNGPFYIDNVKLSE